jgi:hypothetical protein
VNDNRKLLANLTVVEPCSQDWDAMGGDDRRRFCDRCRKEVHNISAMSTDEAATLLRAASDARCVRFFREPDGTVVTTDAPRTLLRRWRAAVLAIGLWLCGSTDEASASGDGPTGFMHRLLRGAGPRQAPTEPSRQNVRVVAQGSLSAVPRVRMFNYVTGNGGKTGEPQPKPQGESKPAAGKP